MIKITKEEYLNLKKAELKLDILEAGGVDNWDNYSECFKPEYNDGKSFKKLCKELEEEIKAIKEEE